MHTILHTHKLKNKHTHIHTHTHTHTIPAEYMTVRGTSEHFFSISSKISSLCVQKADLSHPQWVPTRLTLFRNSHSLITAVSNTILSHWLSSGVGGSLWFPTLTCWFPALVIMINNILCLVISRNFSRISGFWRPWFLVGGFFPLADAHAKNRSSSPRN